MNIAIRLQYYRVIPLFSWGSRSLTNHNSMTDLANSKGLLWVTGLITFVTGAVIVALHNGAVATACTAGRSIPQCARRSSPKIVRR
jgi:hypothetical protein